MNQPCTSTTRRVAAIGAAVAIVTASSAFGIGAATAVAAEPTAATSTASSPSTGTPVAPVAPVTTVDTDDRPGGPSTDPTSAPAPETATPQPAAPEPAAPGTPATPVAPAAPAAPAAADAPEDTDESAAPDTITFTEPSTPESPIRIETTAGEEIERTFTATGSSTELHYVLLSGPTAFPVPGNQYPTAPDGLAVGDTSGVLSGTPTVAGEYDFQVMAMNGSRAATAYVHLVVRPAATSGVRLLVGVVGTPRAWLQDEDGLREVFAESTEVVPTDAVPASQGSTMHLRVTPVDAYGNEAAGADDRRPVVTSSVASDEVTLPNGAFEPRIRFVDASRHIVTVTIDDVSVRVPVEVSATVAAPAATTPGAGAGTGQLAFTGADPSSPLAWALGLLAAGGGLLVHRLRRRRA